MQELDKFIQNIKSCKEIVSGYHFGSSTMKKQLGYSDIDLIICSDSNNFHTEKSVYQTLAEHTRGRIKVIIKSIQEFSPTNYVTMSRRFIMHLHNVGRSVYGIDLKEKIDKMWEESKNNSRFEEAYKVSPSLKIRNLVLELQKGHLHKLFEEDTVRKLSENLWQNTVDVFNLELSKQEESRAIERFYEIIQCGEAKEVRQLQKEIEKINDSLEGEGSPVELQGKITETYTRFKNIVERDLWVLNKWLHKKK